MKKGSNMQEQKYKELEERVTRLSEEAIPDGMPNSMFRKLEQRERIRQEIEAMRAEGKAFTLTDGGLTYRIVPAVQTSYAQGRGSFHFSDPPF